MKSKIFIFFFLCACSSSLAAQFTSLSKNLVPNPGFETFSAPPLGWFYEGKHFTRLVKHWSSPTIASPDAFGPRVLVPAQWKEKGFGAIPAHGGKAMVGLTLYGCEGGKPHCREYVQVKLSSPLEKGARYQVAFWTAHLDKSLFIDQLGIALSQEKIDLLEDQRLPLEPLEFKANLIDEQNEDWHYITYTFTAKTSYEYLLIGNFSDDENTITKSDCEDPFGYAYYYIDDVELRKISVSEQLTEIPLKVGETIVLENIYFDTDKHNLLSKSETIVKQLIPLFKNNPSLKIEILGHTDNIGDEAYNLDLSKKRAKAVMSFLISNDIKEDNLSYNGFGATKPIATNNTKEGRQKNRRVEFRIVQN